MAHAEDDDDRIFRERIRDAIQAGGKSGVMSKKTGIPVGTLNKYVALRSVPSVLNALKIAQAIGLTLEELAKEKQPAVISEGEIFADPSKAPVRPEPVDAELMERLHDRVFATFRDLGQKPPARRITREATNIYNELARIVPDLADGEMLDVTIPKIVLEFKRRLQQGDAEPGSGKRSAS